MAKFGPNWRDKFRNVPDDSLMVGINRPLGLGRAEEGIVEQVKKPQVDFRPQESGVGFGTRAGASFFRGPQEEEYLKKNLQPGETLVRGPDGSLRVQDASGVQRPVDPSGEDWGDIADVAGYLPEVLGGTFGAVKGATFGFAAIPFVGAGVGGALGGAAGSTVGEGVRQFGAEMIDPEVAKFEPGRLGESAAYGAAGELGPVAIKTLGQATKGGMKLGAKAFGLEKGARGEVPMRIQENVERLGVEPSTLPVSATTESPLAAGVDVHLRQSPFSRGAFKERDEAFRGEMEGALGRTRLRIGGGLDDDISTAVSSNIDPEVVGKSLIQNNDEATKLLDGSIADAGQSFMDAVGQPLENIPAVTPSLDALARTSAADLTQQPGLMALPETAAEKGFFAATERKSLAQLISLRRIAGEMMNTQDRAQTGKKLYAAILDDLDATWTEFAKTAPLGELQASGAASAYKRIIDISRRQYDVLDSPLVAKLFPHGAPNIHKLGEVAETLQRADVGPESVRLLKERIGVGLTEGLGTFKNTLEGKESVGLPITEQGGFIWDQIQQLYLDTLLHKLSRVPGELDIGGQRFYNELFGTAKSERVTQEIFGDVTRDLRAFSEILRDSQMSEMFFKNWSNTGVYNELKEAVRHPIRGAIGALGKLGAAQQFSRRQGPDALLGREYFSKGQLPDIGQWLHGHRKLALTVRAASQVGPRQYLPMEGGEGISVPTQIGTIQQPDEER